MERPRQSAFAPFGSKARARLATFDDQLRHFVKSNSAFAFVAAIGAGYAIARVTARL